MQFIINPFTGELTPIGQSGGTEPVLTINGNTGSVTPTSGGVVNIVGTGGVTTAGSGSTLTISVTGAGFSWNDEATSFAASAQNGYFVTALATATLPASPSQGDTIIINMDTSSNVTIQANTGQVISIGANVSTSAGTATGSVIGNSVTLVYRASDTTWRAISVIGSWLLA